MFADIRTEWRVNDIERALQQKADSGDLSSTNSDVGRLEHSLREACSTLAGLCNELQAATYKIELLEQAILELQTANIPT